MADFQFALENDVKPAFGISEEELDSYIKNGDIVYDIWISNDVSFEQVLSRGDLILIGYCHEGR